MSVTVTVHKFYTSFRTSNSKIYIYIRTKSPWCECQTASPTVKFVNCDVAAGRGGRGGATNLEILVTHTRARIKNKTTRAPLSRGRGDPCTLVRDRSHLLRHPYTKTHYFLSHLSFHSWYLVSLKLKTTNKSSVKHFCVVQDFASHPILLLVFF